MDIIGGWYRKTSNLTARSLPLRQYLRVLSGFVVPLDSVDYFFTRIKQ